MGVDAVAISTCQVNGHQTKIGWKENLLNDSWEGGKIVDRRDNMNEKNMTGAKATEGVHMPQIKEKGE